MPRSRVAVVFGSDSDWPVMEACIRQLRHFDEEPHVEVMSAHRNPQRVADFVLWADKNSVEVIIAAAGMSNALAGAVAAHTCLPVIGVPLANSPLQGMDSLLSTVQMPPGTPVACMSVGEAGAKNAAILAVQILARNDAELAQKLRAFKVAQSQSVEAKNRALQEKLRR